MLNALIFYYQIDQNINRNIDHHSVLILKEIDSGYYILMNKYIKLNPYDDSNIFYFFRKDGFIQSINFGSHDEYKDFIKRYSPLHELYVKKLKSITIFSPVWNPDSISKKETNLDKNELEIIDEIYIEI